MYFTVFVSHCVDLFMKPQKEKVELQQCSTVPFSPRLKELKIALMCNVCILPFLFRILWIFLWIIWPFSAPKHLELEFAEQIQRCRSILDLDLMNFHPKIKVIRVYWDFFLFLIDDDLFCIMMIAWNLSRDLDLDL